MIRLRMKRNKLGGLIMEKIVIRYLEMGKENKEEIGQCIDKKIIDGICDGFWNISKIAPNNEVKAIFKFLVSPESVYKMMMASDFGLPSLTFVVKDLEELSEKFTDAPLNHNGQYQNAVNRQNVGRMVKYIMREFGYEPIVGKLNERARLPKFSGSKYFSTSAVYAKKQ